MAPDSLRRPLLALVLVAAACGGGKKNPEADASVDLAAMRAQRDSIRLADSTVRVRFMSCSDSVILAMGKTPDGKKKLAVKPPEGMIRPEVLSSCGKPPAMPAAAAATASATAQAPTAAPAQKLTPQQLAVQRADSSFVRRRSRPSRIRSRPARSWRGRTRCAGLQSDSIRGDSLQRARETEVLRESFTYAGGSRDPFVSLISTAKVGPEFSDLILLGIHLDLRRPSNSVAVLRDKNSLKRYNSGWAIRWAASRWHRSGNRTWYSRLRTSGSSDRRPCRCANGRQNAMTRTQLFAIATATLLAATPGRAATPPAGQVTAVSIVPTPGRAEIVINIRGAVEVKDFVLREPDRLVVST